LKKVKKEMSTVIDSSPVQYQTLRNLEYTVQVIEESLRLYPPFWIVDRVAMSDDIVEGVFIPGGTTIMLFFYDLHHSLEYWDDPEIFNPDRFASENINKHTPFTHVPFGGGPRVCIGSNYAMIQMILILKALVMKYEFELVENQNIEVQPMIMLQPKDGIKMRFKKIT
jgi:cytochrome P450